MGRRQQRSRGRSWRASRPSSQARPRPSRRHSTHARIHARARAPQQHGLRHEPWQQAEEGMGRVRLAERRGAAHGCGRDAVHGLRHAREPHGLLDPHAPRAHGPMLPTPVPHTLALTPPAPSLHSAPAHPARVGAVRLACRPRSVLAPPIAPSQAVSARPAPPRPPTHSPFFTPTAASVLIGPLDWVLRCVLAQ